MLSPGFWRRGCGDCDDAPRRGALRLLFLEEPSGDEGDVAQRSVLGLVVPIRRRLMGAADKSESAALSRETRMASRAPERLIVDGPAALQLEVRRAGQFGGGAAVEARRPSACLPRQ